MDTFSGPKDVRLQEARLHCAQNINFLYPVSNGFTTNATLQNERDAMLQKGGESAVEKPP